MSIQGSTADPLVIRKRAFWTVVIALILLIMAALAAIQTLLPGRLAEIAHTLMG